MSREEEEEEESKTHQRNQWNQWNQWNLEFVIQTKVQRHDAERTLDL